MITDESITIEVTTRCNSHCRHCFARSAQRTESSLPLKMVIDLLAEGYQLGYRRVHLTGGEPLLWAGLMDVLDHAAGLGFEEIFLNTNGTLLDATKAARLSTYPGISVSVSIEGPPDRHALMRGKGTLEPALRGMGAALAAGIKLYAFTTVTKGLLPQLPWFVEQLYDTNPDIRRLCLIQLIHTGDDGFSLTEELLQPIDFIKLVRMAALLNRMGHKVEILNNPLALAAARCLDLPWLPPTRPLQRREHITVMANGELTLSHSHGRSLGNYTGTGLHQILESRAYRKATAADTDACPQCKYYPICRDSGMLRPSRWFRDMQPAEPYCRRVLGLIPGAM
jgi:radical SAM protein with 4Fe4S-binding SPASM domain